MRQYAEGEKFVQAVEERAAPNSWPGCGGGLSGSPPSRRSAHPGLDARAGVPRWRSTGSPHRGRGLTLTGAASGAAPGDQDLDPAVDPEMGRRRTAGPDRGPAAPVHLPAAGSALACAVSGGPDSMALMVLALAAGCAVTAVHVDHGLRPGSAAEARVVAEAARRSGPRSGRSGWRSGRGRTSRPGPGRPATGCSPGGGYRPHRRRPGRDGTDQPAAGGGVRRVGRDEGRAPSPPARPAARRDRRGVRAIGSIRWRSHQRPPVRRNRVRHELLPLCSDMAGRDIVPVLARQAGVLAARCRTSWRPRPRPIPRTPGPSPPPGAVGRRAVRNWLRRAASRRRHPPPLDAVERVLEVARDGAWAPSSEAAGGCVDRRPAGRGGAGISDSVAPVTTADTGAVVPSSAQPGDRTRDRRGRRAAAPDRRAGRTDHRRLRRSAPPCWSAC